MAAQHIKQIQEALGVTNYEFSHILGVSEKTVEAWRGGWRTPQGSAQAFLNTIGEMLEKGGRITKEDLLMKVGYRFD